MAFPDPASFFKTFGIMFLIGAFTCGFTFLALIKFKKAYPNFRHWFKFSVMRKKHNEKEITQLLQYRDAKMSYVDVQKLILLKGDMSTKKASEFCYIYEKILEKEVKQI